MPKRRSQITNPPDSHKSGMRDIRVRNVLPTKAEREAERERARTGEFKSSGQTPEQKEKLAERRAARKRKKKLGRYVNVRKKEGKGDRKLR